MIDLLDISRVQSPIDWPRVIASRVHPDVDRYWRGVIVKVSEGASYKDPDRLKHLEGARAVGLRVGVYHFMHPMQDVDAQVKNLWAAIGDTVPHFRVAIDLEAADPSLTSAQLLDRLRRARDRVADHFFRWPMVYSYPDFWTRRMLPALASAYDIAETMKLWWAFYGAGRPWMPTRSQVPIAPDPWRTAGLPITVWQYSGNTKKVPGRWTGHVPGIPGDVDRNLFLGDEEAWREFCGGVGGPGELEAPIVRPPVPLDRLDELDEID